MLCSVSVSGLLFYSLVPILLELRSSNSFFFLFSICSNGALLQVLTGSLFSEKLPKVRLFNFLAARVQDCIYLCTKRVLIYRIMLTKLL